jgi:hypothetical protein
MPWWVSTGIEARIVDSCPPPIEAVEVRMEAGFPERAPEDQSPPVASKKAFICFISRVFVREKRRERERERV